jgi:hypothetical protein
VLLLVCRCFGVHNTVVAHATACLMNISHDDQVGY